MADRRVAITGLGVVTPAGNGIEAFWEGLLQGRRAVSEIDLFDASKFPCRIGGQLPGFSARDHVSKEYRKAVKVMARDVEIAVGAANLAFRDAKIVTRGIDPGNINIDSKRLGCNIGAGLIFTELQELGSAVSTAIKEGKFDIRLWGESGMNNLTPLWLLKYLPNMLSCHVTIIHGAEGPSNCITCGDTSGILSVGESTRVIERGGADVVVAGGAESKLNPMGLLRQNMLGRLCTARNDSPATACRPFDLDHCGTVIGEGGGVLILEELSRAQARGARIYAEVAGFGAACDPAGIDVTKPTAGSLDLALRRALGDARIDPSAVGMICTHGTAVAGEDQCEARAWHEALGDSGEQVPAAAFAGSTGSLFAGAGGVSLALAAMALHDQIVPPTANFSSAAEGCALNFAPQPRQAKIEYAVCGAFAVGGQSAACVLKRSQG